MQNALTVMDYFRDVVVELPTISGGVLPVEKRNN